MHLLGAICFFLLLMAEVIYPACNDSFKNRHGLSLHTKHWCKKQNAFSDLLQQHQDISKPALPYTVPHRLVQSHRAHRKVPTNTELHRVHRVCTALYRPIQTPPICTVLVFPGLAQGLYTRIDNNAITILFQTLIALQILAYKATNILAITNYYIHGVVTRDTT